MDFNVPTHILDYLAEIDAFIEAEIKPLQAQDDNERFFDHRREWARTDFDNDGLPRQEWEALLDKAAPRGQGGLFAVLAADRIRRQGRRQPLDGGHPRASRGEGPGPAQRSAERAFDRRQFPAS